MSGGFVAEHPKLGTYEDEQRKRQLARDAELWLTENDSSYRRESVAWKHFRADGFDYSPPGREVPWDEENDGDLSALMSDGGGRPIGESARARCEVCQYFFEPSRTDKAHCSNACKQKAYRVRNGAS